MLAEQCFARTTAIVGCASASALLAHASTQHVCAYRADRHESRRWAPKPSSRTLSRTSCSWSSTWSDHEGVCPAPSPPHAHSGPALPTQSASPGRALPSTPSSTEHAHMCSHARLHLTPMYVRAQCDGVLDRLEDAARAKLQTNVGRNVLIFASVRILRTRELCGVLAWRTCAAAPAPRDARATTCGCWVCGVSVGTRLREMVGSGAAAVL